MDPVTAALAQYGAVGLLAVLGILAVRVLYTRREEAQKEEITRLAALLELEQRRVEKESQRADRLQDDLGRLNEAVRSGYTDAITKSAQAISEANRLVADILANSRRS